MSKVKETLVNELHRQVRVMFPRRHYKQKGLCETLQADLVSMENLKNDNRNFAYILIVIDGFSKVAYAEPLKTKSGIEVAQAFEKILNKFRYSKNVKFLFVDRGTEFYNSYVKRFLKKKNIKMYSVYTKIKAGIAERFIKTLKNLCYKNFGYIGSYNWVDHIESLIFKYNNTVHRTIGLRPAEIRKKHEKFLLQNVYNKVKFKQKTHFSVGDFVRISDLTGTFRRGFQTQWSPAIYRIFKVQNTYPITFKLFDEYANKNIHRAFYKEELQKVKYPRAFLVEKVIKEQGNKILVKWLGFDDTHNSYILKKDLL